MEDLVLRRIGPNDWRVFREVRLEALRTEPGVFSSSLARERALGEADWRGWLTAGAVFGLFDGAELVGITGAYTDRDDPSGATAGLGMSYLRPAYRGQGLADRFYEERLAWIRTVAGHRRVVSSHRASNAPSRRAMQRHGFVRTGERTASWPDGGVEDEWLYELRL